MNVKSLHGVEFDLDGIAVPIPEIGEKKEKSFKEFEKEDEDKGVEEIDLVTDSLSLVLKSYYTQIEKKGEITLEELLRFLKALSAFAQRVSEGFPLLYKNIIQTTLETINQLDFKILYDKKSLSLIDANKETLLKINQFAKDYEYLSVKDDPLFTVFTSQKGILTRDDFVAVYNKIKALEKATSSSSDNTDVQKFVDKSSFESFRNSVESQISDIRSQISDLVEFVQSLNEGDTSASHISERDVIDLVNAMLEERQGGVDPSLVEEILYGIKDVSSQVQNIYRTLDALKRVVDEVGYKEDNSSLINSLISDVDMLRSKIAEIDHIYDRITGLEKNMKKIIMQPQTGIVSDQEEQEEEGSSPQIEEEGVISDLEEEEEKGKNKGKKEEGKDEGGKGLSTPVKAAIVTMLAFILLFFVLRLIF